MGRKDKGGKKVKKPKQDKAKKGPSGKQDDIDVLDDAVDKTGPLRPRIRSRRVHAPKRQAWPLGPPLRGLNLAFSSAPSRGATESPCCCRTYYW